MDSKKNKRHDNYDLTQPSISGKPGWERFRSERDRQHYFHFNDGDGKPLLFSEGYPAQPERDKGIASVVKNAAKRDRYTVSGDKNRFWFVLKAGNNLEIGRSRDFASAQERDAALEYLLIKGATGSVANNSAPKTNQKEPERPYDKAGIAIPELDAVGSRQLEVGSAAQPALTAVEVKAPKSEGPPMAEAPAKAPITEAKKSKSAASNTSEAGPANDIDVQDAMKYTYRIELYRNKENEGYDGRIENVRSKRKGSFSGMDTAFINGFIAQDIPELEVKIVEPSAAAPAEVSLASEAEVPAASAEAVSAEVEIPAKPEAKIIQRPSIGPAASSAIGNDNLRVEIMPKGDACNCKSIPSNLPFDVGISLKGDALSTATPSDGKIAFELFIESVTGNPFITRWTTEATLVKGSKTKLSVSQQVPFPGVYRLLVFSKDRPDAGEELAGSMLMNVY